MAADCDDNAERGRLSINTTNNRLYICNGATRGWDYLALTDWASAAKACASSGAQVSRWHPWVSSFSAPSA